MQQENTWQRGLAEIVSDPNTLCKILNLNYKDVFSNLANEEFKLRVPVSFIERMEKGNPNDPLLKQVLPVSQELENVTGYSRDPLQEKSANLIPGLLHKYKSRVLLLISGACAINCRYCFRRHFPYEDNNPGLSGWKKAFTYIQDNTSINEVIFSGGDPLVAKDAYLANLAEHIANIPHIKTLRIHSRLPIVLPERVTDTFVDWLTSTRLKPVMVVHCNHPNEINDKVRSALQRLHKAGVTLLNQTVLLGGINDDIETLTELSQTLFDANTLPYYLHILDPVQGAGHFDVGINKAKALARDLTYHLPGYLVPKLVKEIPNEPAKYNVPLDYTLEIPSTDNK